MKNLARRSRRNLVPAALLGAVIVASAGTGAVADQLIGSRGVANDSLRSIDIKNETLASRDIKNGTVRGLDVRDGSLTAADFEGGVVRGEQGPRGEVGPAGETGPAGIQGEAGSVGPAGADGADGAVGPQGERGPAGPAGESIQPAVEIFTLTVPFTAEARDFGGFDGAGFETASQSSLPANSVITATEVGLTSDCSDNFGVYAQSRGRQLASAGNKPVNDGLNIVVVGRAGEPIRIIAENYGTADIGCQGTFSLEFAVQAKAEGPSTEFN